MKARPFSVKTTICQTPEPRMRASEPRMRGAARPTMIPAVTTESTPDTPSASAGSHAPNGASSEISTSTGGSLRRLITKTIA